MRSLPMFIFASLAALPVSAASVTVSGALPVAAPVITDGIVDTAFDVPRFDPSLGTLTSASIEFFGSITSTAVFFELFPSGFGAVANSLATSAIDFRSATGAPTFTVDTLELIAVNAQFFFGSTSLPLNTVSGTGAVPLTDLQNAVGTDPFAVEASFAGSFFGIGGSLPQQAVLFGADVTYTFDAAESGGGDMGGGDGQPSPVPLPAGLPLLMVALGAFGLARRRRT